MYIILFLSAVIAVLIFYFFFIYNDLISCRIRVKEAWSQIDVQLKRRVDFIPNLVETVKGYVKHEKTLLENLTKARSALLTAQGPKESASADNMLTSTLKSLFAVAENYPNLKASENFLQLQKELSDTEDKIAYARQFYNKVVMDINTKLEIFPNVLVAQKLGFKKVEFFDIEESERKNIEIKFA